MLFNSSSFLFFFPVVFLVYWLVCRNSLVKQNHFLLAASYWFYGSWDYRFLFLLIFSTLLDYYTGQKIQQAQDRSSRKIWLIISVAANLAFLGFFKYYNFFADSFAEMVSIFGWKPSIWTLQVVLPVGISFYTFHGLSYVFDIYNGRIKPTNNIIQYCLFVSFFPLLVAGPIERATHLLPQLEKLRRFNYSQAVMGMRQILWGFFKKVVIADNCAYYADMTFNNPDQYNTVGLILGVIFFSFQIYCDFSGYSDIALGTARLLGIELLRNFSFPYFSRDVPEFWRRWHMSLTSWFRDYLYVPLGGSRGELFIKIRNTVIVFLVSGFWHGANWTFLFWGALNACYFLPYLIFERNRTYMEIVALHTNWPQLKDVFNMLATFALISLSWIFFRAESLTTAFQYIRNLIQPSEQAVMLPLRSLIVLLFIGFTILVEWLGRRDQFALENLFAKRPRAIRWGFYMVLIFLMGMFMQTVQTPFLYFQF